MKLDTWAIRWGIPKEAIEDLRKSFGLAQLELVVDAQCETDVSNLIRYEASKKGCRLWRNNVGALQNKDGGWVRYGLANESKNMNGYIKSSDLIGIKPIKIQETMVGMTIGQFLCREVKKRNWSYKGDERESAQLRWIELINGLGGDACFATNEGTI